MCHSLLYFLDNAFIFHSLLGMLAGRTNDDWMQGDIFVNGEPRKKSFRLQCGFVVQVSFIWSSKLCDWYSVSHWELVWVK